jgi:hypothetical protein
VAKNTKAQDVLAKWKADASKATLPPLAEKSSKLLKVNETLARSKTEAAKVTAAEREKKKVHDSSPDDVPAPSKTVELINKIILRNFWAKSG